MRLDAFIAAATGESRSIAKKYIKEKRVTLSGDIAKSPAENTDGKTVTLDGKTLTVRKNTYLLMNKPAGYVSTTENIPESVLSLVPPEYKTKGLSPAGRLDKDTEGFVLLTDDGALAHRMLSPKTHVPKTYFVRLRDPWQENYAQAFAEGMTIDGGEKCLPADFSASVNCPDECTVVLHEGKYHQVKRMFEKLGNKVVFLKRIKIGELPLDPDLPLGSCLEIMHKDVERLLTAKSFKCK